MIGCNFFLLLFSLQFMDQIYAFTSCWWSGCLPDPSLLWPIMSPLGAQRPTHSCGGPLCTRHCVLMCMATQHGATPCPLHLLHIVYRWTVFAWCPLTLRVGGHRAHVALGIPVAASHIKWCPFSVLVFSLPWTTMTYRYIHLHMPLILVLFHPLPRFIASVKMRDVTASLRLWWRVTSRRDQRHHCTCAGASI